MRIEFAPPTSGRRYRLVLQDGFEYHDDIREAIKSAKFHAAPGQMVELPEGMKVGEIEIVNHLPHYISHPSGIECITITEWMNFNLGNAMKYIWRAGQKSSTKDIEDLKKARWYLDREIARLEKV
jgi:hypothetical protein